MIDDWYDVHKLEGISDFEHSMCVANPFRMQKFGEFMNSFEDYDTGLKSRIVVHSKEKGDFWKMADYFQHCHSREFRDLWISELPKHIKSYVESIHQSDKFTGDEAIRIEENLNEVFNIDTITQKMSKKNLISIFHWTNN